MDQQEYDKKYRSKVPLMTEEIVGTSDGTPWKPTITVVNSTAEEMYQREMEQLSAGGADYAGLEQLGMFKRRLRR
jgi:hypothetical protein